MMEKLKESSFPIVHSPTKRTIAQALLAHSDEVHGIENVAQ